MAEKRASSASDDDDEFVDVSHPTSGSLSLSVERDGEDEAKIDELCIRLTDPIPVTGMSWRKAPQRPLTPTVESTRAKSRKPGVVAFIMLGLVTNVCFSERAVGSNEASGMRSSSKNKLE